MTSRSFVPRNISVNTVSQERTHSKMNNLPLWVLGIFLDCCFQAVCLPVFLPIFPGAVQFLEGSYQPSLLTFRTPGFKPCWLQLRKLSPLIFRINGFGKTFSLCVPLYAPLSLALLCDPGSLPSEALLIHFSPKYVSSLLPFFNVVFSLPLAVEFVLLIFRLIYWVFRMI